MNSFRISYHLKQSKLTSFKIYVIIASIEKSKKREKKRKEIALTSWILNKLNYKCHNHLNGVWTHYPELNKFCVYIGFTELLYYNLIGNQPVVHNSDSKVTTIKRKNPSLQIAVVSKSYHN